MEVSAIVHHIQKEELIDKSKLLYMKGPENPNSAASPVTIGGNIDVKERKRYFNYFEGTNLLYTFSNYRTPGFLVSKEDKKFMEQCKGVVVISAIFGAYDKIKQPKNVRKILAENVCFFMFMDNATLTILARY